MTAAFEQTGTGLVVERLPARAPDPVRALGQRAPNAVVLRSGPGDPRLSRWSYAALEPCGFEPSLEAARAALSGWAVPTAPGLPPFFGGAVFHHSYDLGWATAPKPRIPRADPLDMPQVGFQLFDAVYARDEQTGAGYLIAQDTPGAQTRLRNLKVALHGEDSKPSGGLEGPLSPAVTQATHEARVREVLELIRAGEVYQVNLTYPLEGRFSGAPEAAFARLVAGTPPPFAAFVGLGGAGALVSASPECFFHFDAWRGELSTYPIKGTIRRAADRAEDRRLAEQLAADPKERAEHVMIVDLLRNDLGRLARPGDVRVDGLAYVESFPTVHHLTSRVVARLPVDTPDAELWSALFPGGSITGAPKLRAMQIIDRLEAAPRGIYTGAIGYLAADGSLGASIAIRTAQVSQGHLRFGVGGGIVADSDPAREWAETEVKARALARALRG